MKCAKSTFSIVLATSLGLAGCAVPSLDTAPRSAAAEPITLQQALISLNQALFAAQNDQTSRNEYTGLDICTAQVVLALSATGTGAQAGTLTVGAGAPIIPATVGGSLSNTQTLVDSKTNTITLTFTTPACNGAGTLGTQNPSQVTYLAEQNQYVREGHFGKTTTEKASNTQAGKLPVSK